MIEVKNLVKTYNQNNNPVEALKGISLSINKGEIFGVIGLSGAGKSSLVRCISFIEKPTSGEIIINNKNFVSLTEKELRGERKKIGMIFQHFNLLKNRTVFENIALPLELCKENTESINKRVNELLEIVGLTEKKNAFPNMLSGGQKQRVGIARALSTNPDILICDEATSALDPVTTKSILELLKEINIKFNITILMITHEMNVIKEICQKVAILEDGKIIESGDVVSIFVKPKTQTAKTFFEDANLKMSNHAYEKVFAKKNRIFKVNFIGDNSVDAFISKAVKKFDVDIAILAGNIQEISQTVIGTLIIEIIGQKDNVTSTLKYFTQENLILEELKENDR